MPKDKKTEEIDSLNQKEKKVDANTNKRGDSYRYGENVKDNDIKQKEQKDRQTRSEQTEKNRKREVDEEDRNKKFINDRISEETANRVYVEEPKKQLKEQEEHGEAAAAASKKLAGQKIDTGESKTLKEEVVFDTINSINDNMSKACMYLGGEDLARANKFARYMEAFIEAVSSGKIVMNEKQASDFAAFGKHDEVVDKASALGYVNFAFENVLPFIASVAIVAGIVLGAEQPLSGLSKINDLLNSAPVVKNISNNISNLGDNLLH